MTDVHTPEIRSYNMSRIKSRDTAQELLVRKFLFSHGIRYRLYDKKLSGKPDIIIHKSKTVIFLNGCFWHGHKGCKYFVIPKTRTEWWLNKINTTKKKDKKNHTELRKENWKVIIIWECELHPSKKEKTLNKILNFINFGNTSN
jgi:DNA mismatch endonuclease, patch repair protein